MALGGGIKMNKGRFVDNISGSVYVCVTNIDDAAISIEHSEMMRGLDTIVPQLTARCQPTRSYKIVLTINHY